MMATVFVTMVGWEHIVKMSVQKVCQSHFYSYLRGYKKNIYGIHSFDQVSMANIAWNSVHAHRHSSFAMLPMDVFVVLDSPEPIV